MLVAPRPARAAHVVPALHTVGPCSSRLVNVVGAGRHDAAFDLHAPADGEAGGFGDDDLPPADLFNAVSAVLAVAANGDDVWVFGLSGTIRAGRVQLRLTHARAFEAVAPAAQADQPWAVGHAACDVGVAP